MPLIRKPPSGEPPQPAPSDTASGLTSASADARWSAARALGRMPGHSQTLVAALQRESDPRVRDALFTALAKVGDDVAIRALCDSIRSPDAAMRTGALDALATMPDEIIPQLGALLRDPDPDVRILSCDLARRIPAALATKELSGLLEREEVANVCAAAAEVLTEVGEPDAIPALQAAKARFADDEFLGYAMDAAIRTIGDSAQKPSLS